MPLKRFYAADQDNIYANAGCADTIRINTIEMKK